jgi:hypothetical protein
LAALAASVEDKLVHQLRGSFSNADELEAAVAALPGAASISDLLRQMKEGGFGDELLPLL